MLPPCLLVAKVLVDTAVTVIGGGGADAVLNCTRNAAYALARSLAELYMVRSSPASDAKNRLFSVAGCLNIATEAWVLQRNVGGFFATLPVLSTFLAVQAAINNKASYP